MSNSPCIELNNITKIFSTDVVETTALNNINLNIEHGEFVSVTGTSGCGKSTLLSVVGLLDNQYQGTYKLHDQFVDTLSSNELAEKRNTDIGFIFQSFNLISDMSIFENVEVPLTFRKDFEKSKRKDAVRIALESVGLGHRIDHLPYQLSGGQQQRVAIARAIVGNPKLLLADEPTGNLDSKSASEIMNIIRELNNQGTTVFMVTHDTSQLEDSDRKIIMKDGEIL